jgi:hypothetical protein
MNLLKARPGQRGAIETIIERVLAGQSRTGIVLPPAYGKSDVIRVAAIHLWEMKAICCSLILSPNQYLRDQIIHRDKLDPCLLRYHLPLGIHYKAIQSHGTNYAANGECLLSTTIQLVQQGIDAFTLWVESMIHTTALPVLLFIDETHSSTHNNDRGESALALERAGALIVSLTGTPWREDDAPLIGFEKEYVKSESVTVVKTKPGSRPDRILVEIWGGTKYYYQLKPHFETTFKEAWAENVICKLNHHPFDLHLSQITLDGEHLPNVMLSELSESETRRWLGKLVRHPLVIRHGVRELVSWLKRTRAINPMLYGKCAALVFTANDETDDSNEHAEKIKAEILAIDHSLTVVIATSADGKGKTQLERFVEDEHGDVLIVKQMAGVGVDSERLKIVLDLSPIRTPSSFVQRANRATRPYKYLYVAHLITLNDVFSIALFQRMVTEQGGETATSDLELERAYETPKKDSPPLPLFVVNGIKISDVSDNNLKIAPSKMLPRVLRIIDAFPMLPATMSVPEIYERSSALWTEPEEISVEAEPVNTGDLGQQKRHTINEIVHDFINFLFTQQTNRTYRSGDAQNQEIWKTIARTLWREVYRRCGVMAGTKLDQINDLTLLERISATFETLIEEGFASSGEEREAL